MRKLKAIVTYIARAWLFCFGIHAFLLFLGVIGYQNAIEKGDVEKAETILRRLYWLPLWSVIYSVIIKWVVGKAEAEKAQKKDAGPN
jgi:hypothetical protein